VLERERGLSIESNVYSDVFILSGIYYFRLQNWSSSCLPPLRHAYFTVIACFL